MTTTTTPRVLTEPFIRALKPAPFGTRYSVTDALVPGFSVRVTDKGTKTFILWRRIDPRASSASALSLGRVGELSLADARNKAREWLAQLAAGTDPREVQRAARENTVAAAVELFLARHVKGQRKAEVVKRQMQTEIVSRWGKRPLPSITRRNIIAMVDEIVDRGAPAQARNVLGNTKVFFSWCVERNMLELSPADGIKPGRLIGAKLPRQRVLNDDEIRLLWQACEQMGYPYGPCFRMLLLTGQRRSEVAETRWSEFDLTNKLWTIPPERFKSNATHIVPLSDAVLELLEQLPRWSRTGDFLFSATGGRKPINGFTKAKMRLDAILGFADWRTHDLRRTVRTRLSELRIADNVAEMVIGHSRRGLRRIYDQHQYRQEMHAALEAWALRLRSIVAPPPANVVPLAQKRT